MLVTYNAQLQSIDEIMENPFSTSGWVFSFLLLQFRFYLESAVATKKECFYPNWNECL